MWPLCCFHSLRHDVHLWLIYSMAALMFSNKKPIPWVSYFQNLGIMWLNGLWGSSGALGRLWTSLRWSILKSTPPKDLLSLQLHTEQFPLLKNLKSGWVVTIHQENEKKSMVNQVGCTETHSYRKCHPQCYDPQPGENSKPGASVWGVKGLNLTLGTTTFRTCTWETSPQNMELWKPNGAWVPRLTRLCHSGNQVNKGPGTWTYLL